MERIHDPLSIFSMEHSIIAMGLWFFVQSLPVCFVRLRTRVIVIVQMTGPNEMHSDTYKTYWQCLVKKPKPHSNNAMFRL